MSKIICFIMFVFIFSFGLNGQSTSGFLLSTSISSGDLISGEYNPRIVRSLKSAKFQVDYSLVNWDHTVFRVGVGYHFLKEETSSIDYLIFPLVFQRFIKSKKTGFNSSLVLYPSFTIGSDSYLFNTRIINFNLELAIRAGTNFSVGKHKFNYEIELATPVSSIEKHGILKYITYGLRFSYYL